MQRLSLLLGSVLAVSSFVATGCGGAAEEDAETSTSSDEGQSTNPGSTSSTGGNSASSSTVETTAQVTSDASTTEDTSSEETTTSTTTEETTTTTEEPARIDCEALTHASNAVGEVPLQVTLHDFEGNEIKPHTLCNKPVMILSGDAASTAFISDAKAVDALLEEHYGAGEVKVVYLFSTVAGGHGISVTDFITEIADWGTGDNAGLGDHALAVNDYTRDALKHYFGINIPDAEARRVMFLKPGFEVAQVLETSQIDSTEFKVKLDALVAGTDIPEDPTPFNCEGLLHETGSGTDDEFVVGQVLGKRPLTDIAVNNTGSALDSFEMCNKTLLILTGASSDAAFETEAARVDSLMKLRYDDGKVKAIYILAPTQAEIDDAATGTPLPTSTELRDFVDDLNADSVNASDNNSHVINDSNRTDLNFYLGTGLSGATPAKMMIIEPGFRVRSILDLANATNYQTAIDAAIPSSNP